MTTAVASTRLPVCDEDAGAYDGGALRAAVLPVDAGRSRASEMDVDPARYSAMDDGQLYAEFRAHGDRAAFTALERRYHQPLIHYLQPLVGSNAEEVVQDVMLKVFVSDSYNPERPFHGWLYAVAAHRAIDVLRRENKPDRDRGGAVSLDDFMRSPDGEGVYSVADVRACEAHEIAAARDSAARLLDVVTEVSSEQRRKLPARTDAAPGNAASTDMDVFMLVYYGGCRYQEAAERLDIPVGTVKSRLHRALQLIDKALRLRGLNSESLLVEGYGRLDVSALESLRVDLPHAPGGGGRREELHTAK